MSKLTIFHHNDLDGRCAAAIMVLWANRQRLVVARCIELDYKDVVPVDVIEEGDTVAVVDFSFKPEIMAQVRARAQRVIWCDHHVTAKDYGYDELDGVRDFRNKGLSGCECAWRFCFPTEDIPRAVHLIGDYDSWRLQEQPACFEFYEGMKLNPLSPTDIDWRDLLFTCVAVVDKIIERGRTAMQYRDSYCAEMAKAFGYETEIGGHRAYALNIYKFGSQGFGGRFTEYPICISYAHDGEKYTVGLYSETVDVSVIARGLGGGGHKGAAGFVCDALPFRRTAEARGEEER